ncbi:MAG: DUF4956 domain-containing protein [Clostridium sp.]|nr:DUF4956 domain-containing protein [Clostridium sp.]
MRNIFESIFDGYAATNTIEVKDFLICLFASLLVGLVLALMYMYKKTYTKSFIFTLALLPAVVCVVIMMVNGNVGAGVAVAGAFSLVRFRSAPGTAEEIGMLFLAMGAGLMLGMGYIGYAVLFTLVVGLVSMIYSALDFGAGKRMQKKKTLRITIPEDLDYTDVFSDVLSNFTSEWELVNVKTTNMGSLFKLTYNLTLKDIGQEKEMIDLLRCRNGNLEVAMSRQESLIVEM